MIYEVRTGNKCYSNSTDLEISAEDQHWDKETLKQLWDEHKIVFMSQGDSVTPIQFIPGKNRRTPQFRIGVEDDGTLFFGPDVAIHCSTYWLESLINELQTLNKYVKNINFIVGDRIRLKETGQEYTIKKIEWKEGILSDYATVTLDDGVSGFISLEAPWSDMELVKD